MSEPDPEPEAQPAIDIEGLIEYVRDTRGLDFSGYKRASLTRRFARRFDALRLGSPDEYREYLDRHPAEYAELLNTILINVTAFFRDPETWTAVGELVVPSLVERADGERPVRVWVPGCASGEEAYTVAILLCEAMGEKPFRRLVKIYATDIDDDALATARLGCYPTPAVNEAMPAELADRYFDIERTASVFRKDLRRAVIFGRHDLVRDAPISRIDLLSCRNTLMYFTTEAQTSILARVRYALQPDGFLVLGRSEALASRSALFDPVDHKRRIFRRSSAPPISREHGAGRRRPAVDVRDSADVDLRTLGFDNAQSAQLLIDGDGNIAAANQAARTLLGVGPKDVGRALQDLEVSYRPVDLRTPIETALSEGHPIVLHDVQWHTGSENRQFDVLVTPLVNVTGVLGGVGVAFVEVTALARVQIELERSRVELETAYEELQSTVEELETTNEELQSTNEELETTNEELQSTNEELETMNEELQSTNEELETINDELRERTDELHDVNLFLNSVLTGLRSAVVVVDAETRVQVWNQFAHELWGLRGEEVEGQHLMNLDIGLPLSQLHPALRACLGAEGVESEHVVDAVNRRGRHISCRVRLTPLRRGNDEIVGAILLMDDLTDEATSSSSASGT